MAHFYLIIAKDQIVVLDYLAFYHIDLSLLFDHSILDQFVRRRVRADQGFLMFSRKGIWSE